MNTVGTYWPPVASARVGFKSDYTETRAGMIHTIRLTGLNRHPQSWWYGCLFSMANAPANAVAHVSLRGLDIGDVMTTWTQSLNVWHPLPWMFPGDMTDDLRLELEVRFTCSGTLVSRLAFLTLPEIHPEDDFLFVCESGQPVAAWNTSQHTYATASTGDPPCCGAIYTVIPPLNLLLREEGRRWDPTKVFRLQSWNEWVDM